MAKGTNYWERKDKSGYMLDPENCYVNTFVWVYPWGYKQWSFKIVNVEETPQNDFEVSRVRGSAASLKTWRTPQGAKAHAERVRFDRKWLGAAGITFKEGDAMEEAWAAGWKEVL